MNNMNRPPKRPAVPPQKRRTAPPRTLSPEEIERRRALARARAEEQKKAEAKRAEMLKKMKEEKKKRRAYLAKLFMYRFLVYLIVLTLLLSVIAAVFFVNLRKVDKIQKEDLIYYLADRKKVTLPYDTVVQNDVMYVDFSGIADAFGMALTGDANLLRYVSDTGNEYVKFTPESYMVNVNENSIRLSAPTLYDGEKLFVPLDFITEYMDGILVKYDDKEHTLTVRRAKYGAEDKEITFKPKCFAPLTHIEEKDDIGTITPTT